jgi:DNA-binding NarL/FixJ family response regulator
MHANEEYVRRALQAGATGYLLKGAEPAELELALQAVMRGETYLTPAVSKQVVQNYLQGSGVKTDPLQDLTPRQREVLQLIAEGHSTKEIAYKLNLSVKTVETHRGELMNRLNIHDVAGLVRYAIRTGLVTPDS